jgi:hypothetical protein
MKITYDAEADAMYIYVEGKPGQIVNRTQKLAHGSLWTIRTRTASMGSRPYCRCQRATRVHEGCPEVSLERLIYKRSRS